jgi:cyclo(L-tyrosyl-L-tyrosyl) synthase
MDKICPIIGMSPGNSYFKDDAVRFLLSETTKTYGRAVVFIADIPAISTYEALGYDRKKARNKAILKGNNLKNRTLNMMKEVGLGEDTVRIIDWDTDIAPSKDYKKAENAIDLLYKESPPFREAVQEATRGVLENSKSDAVITLESLEKGTHYLLSELAFLEFAPSFLDVEKIVYVYHRQWPVYEQFIAGAFDGKKRDQLGFLLLEKSPIL